MSELIKNPNNVRGGNFFLARPEMNLAKRNGSSVCDMTNTHTIPMIEMAAIDLSAGCRAKISNPNPLMVVTAERRIEYFMDCIVWRPIAYSCCNPSMMKIL